MVSIELPPLREHMEDLPRLIEHFLERARARNPKARLVRLAPDALETLTGYVWPGNIRELEHLIERLTVLCPEESATLADLPHHLTARRTSVATLDLYSLVALMSSCWT